MATTYTFILRDCPESAKGAVALFLGKAFSLKDSTCAAIAGSTPIILLPDLTRDEAAAMQLALSGLVRLGAGIEFSSAPGDDLPKIDWPRRPQVFKRDVADYVADLQLTVALPGGGNARLIELLAGLVTGGPPGGGTDPAISAPAARSEPTIAPPHPHPPAPPSPSAKPQEFRGIQLPEITPFGGVPALPPVVAAQEGATKPPSAPTGGDDALSRLNQLFPEDESSGFLPNNQDITSILDRLLPEEEAGAGAAPPAAPAQPAPGQGSGSHKTTPSGVPASGYAVFLAKIADEGRRQKAVELIAELGQVSKEAAEALSKKVIIPVLKGATKEAAEGAKQRFAKIGILARVKGPE